MFECSDVRRIAGRNGLAGEVSRVTCVGSVIDGRGCPVRWCHPLPPPRALPPEPSVPSGLGVPSHELKLQVIAVRARKHARLETW